MATSLPISVLTLTARSQAAEFRTGTVFSSVVDPGAFGSRRSAAVSVLTLTSRSSIPPVVYDLLTTIISGSNCPPAPQVPQSGQRYPGFYILS